MRSISRFSVNYPVTVAMIVLGVILLGIISLSRLGTDLFPDLLNPRIYVELKASVCGRVTGDVEIYDV